MRKVLYIFGLLTDADVEWMAQAGVRRRLRDGEILIKERETSDSLILLLEGEMVASTEALGPIARMGVGEIVGEMSLVDSAPPSATVTARGEGLALFLGKAVLTQKLEQDEGFSSRFYRALAIFLADRLRESRQPKASRLDDEIAVAHDELDIGIMDRISAAGERFNRMLRILNSRA
jgi:CRP/FNR family transcriptional regulator, cyclic AMP receptor protein